MKNALKQMLKEGKTAFGAYVSIAHPDVAEIVGSIGFDFVMFDTEHSPLGLESVQMLMQAMSFSKSISLVRAAWNDQVLMKRALDIGASGLIVPWVNSKEDAIRAVRSIRYPPEGIRGFGPRRASLRDPEYVATANRELFLGVQIETQDAIDNIDEILSVDGIDATLIGPNDLSLSLGIWQQWDNPKFTSAVKKVLESSIRHNVTPGSLSTFEWEKRLQEGFRIILVAQDFTVLQNSAASALSEARRYAQSLK